MYNEDSLEPPPPAAVPWVFSIVACWTVTFVRAVTLSKHLDFGSRSLHFGNLCLLEHV